VDFSYVFKDGNEMRLTRNTALALVAALSSLYMGSALAAHHEDGDHEQATTEATASDADMSGHDMSGHDMSGHDMSGHDMGKMGGDDAADPHAMHKKAMQSSDVTVTRVAYATPAVSLVADDGETVALADVFAPDRPVVVNFIFTTCTTICPVMTATMLQMERLLKDEANKPNYVSISIDPDYDTADIMRKYATRYGADWTFLTGSSEDIMTTLQGFDAYRGNKVNHFALTLMRAPGQTEWTRVEGLSSAKELAKIWRETAS
jgi:protein SCO1/2